MSRRKLLVAAVVAVAAAGGSAVWAATQADVVTTVTGCVTSSGQLRGVTTGTAACKSGETPVTLSSGDITSVDTPADGGLTGGAASGAASLSLQQSFRLPQSCASGDVIRWSAALQYWTCGSTFEPKAYEVFRQTVPFTITAVGVFPGEKVLTLSVPPGKYTVSMYIGLTKSDGSGIIRCNTFAEGPGANGNVLVNGSLLAATTLSGQSVEALTGPGTISTYCRQLAGATGAFPVVGFAEIVASSVQDWTSSEDTSSDQYGG